MRWPRGYKDVKNVPPLQNFVVRAKKPTHPGVDNHPMDPALNVALCVNANEDYVKVESKGETYYLAQALCDTVLGEGRGTLF